MHGISGPGSFGLQLDHAHRGCVGPLSAGWGLGRTFKRIKYGLHEALQDSYHDEGLYQDAKTIIEAKSNTEMYT